MILRWAGGKRWLFPEIQHLIPEKINYYAEPFIGGGAIFFRTSNIKRGIISDLNSHLMSFYKFLKNSPDELHDKVSSLISDHSEDKYYERRTEFNQTRCPALFLYLNRTCFNGIYRENQKGQFNVPIGFRNNPTNKRQLNRYLFTRDEIRNFSLKLKNISIKSNDFEEVILGVPDGSFVYIDPPYVDTHVDKIKKETFRSYNAKEFDDNDFIRLHEAISVRKKTCKFIISNFSEPLVKEFFSTSSGWHHLPIDKFSRISGHIKGRKLSKEIVIYN